MAAFRTPELYVPPANRICVRFGKVSQFSLLIIPKALVVYFVFSYLNLTMVCVNLSSYWSVLFVHNSKFLQFRCLIFGSCVVLFPNDFSYFGCRIDGASSVSFHLWSSLPSYVFNWMAYWKLSQSIIWTVMMNFQVRDRTLLQPMFAVEVSELWTWPFVSRDRALWWMIICCGWIRIFVKLVCKGTNVLTYGSILRLLLGWHFFPFRVVRSSR